MPTKEPTLIESESVRAETLETWPAEGGMLSGSVMTVVKTLVRTMADIGTTTAKIRPRCSFLEAGATFSSGLEAHNIYYGDGS
jgi:hypothetical protein